MTRIRTWHWLPLFLMACSSSDRTTSGLDPLPDTVPMEPSPAVTPLDRILGPTQRATRALPAISGGTLAAGERGGRPVAVASDPEHDRLWIVENAAGAVQKRALDLPAGAEPGRVVIAGERAFVALRHSGQLAVVDLTTEQITAQVDVCAAPRGLAVDAASDTLAVACASGELVLRRASTLAPEATYALGADLRDVVLDGEEILVSRFRSAELLVLRRQDGAVVDQKKPATQPAVMTKGLTPIKEMPASVAWRMVPVPGGHAVVLHQRHVESEIPTTSPGGYGRSSCESIVQTGLTQAGEGRLDSTGGLDTGLAVDVAVRGDGLVVLATPGDNVVSSFLDVPFAQGSERPWVPIDGRGKAPGMNGVSGHHAIHSTGSDEPADFVGFQTSPCGPDTVQPIGFRVDAPSSGRARLSNPARVDAVAVAFDRDDHLVMQTRAPHGLWWAGHFVPFGGDAETTDTGHQVFHMDSGGGLACASCHPEGGEDGRVWNFETFGPRRTQSLHGLRGSEPFHWSGDMVDIGTLMSSVFSGRMSGPQASPAQADALVDWLDQVPLVPPPSVDAGARERGRAVYESAEVGCLDCHQGSRLALAGTFDVGTGEPLQVPSLRGLAYRAPFLHDGRAATLLDRFGPGGGGDQHGRTSQLTAAQLDDLVAYLTSL